MAEQVDYQIILQELLAKARQAAENANSNDDYHQGLRMAYYDILSFALDQGLAFDVSAADLGLAGFDPAHLLRERATCERQPVT
ncbi:MAG: hypothetical protein U1F76_24030 [Candidatus Competibacteraceae bacterium]